MQLLNDAAGGQRPVDGGEMRRPRGCGKLSSEGRISTFPARALEECGLAWGMRRASKKVKSLGSERRGFAETQEPVSREDTGLPAR